MELSQIRSDVDALLEEHKENWMNHVFGSQPEVCKTFKEKQVCQAMLIMAIINIAEHRVKNPVVSTQQEGWDLRFTWKYENQYYLSLTMIIPWEGELSYEINTFAEGDPDGPMKYGEWDYKKFTSVAGNEVSEFAEDLENATVRDIENENGTGKETIR